MENNKKQDNTTPALLAARLTEALGLVHDLGESLLLIGDSKVLDKFRRLKTLLSDSMTAVSPRKKSRVVVGHELVEDYHQEVVELLIELAFVLMSIDAETGDSELEAISLQAETAVERINRYFEVKTRAKL